MREDRKSLRQQQIEDAAYEVLESKGYGGTSMLGIARIVHVCHGLGHLFQAGIGMDQDR